MTTTTDKLPHVLQENIAVSHSSENTDLLINVNVHINTVSIPKARLYPFNSNGLQRHNLGRMDRSCPFCGALKWVDERCGDWSKHSPMLCTREGYTSALSRATSIVKGLSHKEWCTITRISTKKYERFASAPVILLRNINPSEGLCNGTRLICCALRHML